MLRCSVESNSSTEKQHTRLLCPSLSLGVCSNSCPLNQNTICHLVLSHPLLSLPWILPSIRVFYSELSPEWGSQSIGASTSGLVLLMNIQGWSPLGLTSLILLSKGLSRVFSRTTNQNHQFFEAEPSLWSNSHIHTWLLEKS